MYEDVLQLWYSKKINAWEAVLLLNERYDLSFEKGLELIESQMKDAEEYLDKQENLYKQLGGD